MFTDKEFRTVILGGYHKEDVREYIEVLKKKAEMDMFGLQSEIAVLKIHVGKLQEEKESLEEALHFQQDKEESNPEIGTEMALEEQEKEELLQEIADLKAENTFLMESKSLLENEIEEVRKEGVASEESMKLEEEIRELKSKKEKYEEDYQAIVKVLEDARMSAQYIQEEAQKKAEEILAQARKESRELVEIRKRQVDKKLEEKGIRLMAAKYKIEAYRKEIYSAQQKLFGLYSEMGKMVEDMPQRLEQLWNEEFHIGIPDKENSGGGEGEGRSSKASTESSEPLC